MINSSIAEPGLTPHELRHTAASLAVSAGANVKAVQAMLSHASAAMTLDTYADLFDDDLDAVADRLDAVLVAARGLLADSLRTRGQLINLPPGYLSSYKPINLGLVDRAACRIRTDDLSLTRRLLWPTELRRQRRRGYRASPQARPHETLNASGHEAPADLATPP